MGNTMAYPFELNIRDFLSIKGDCNIPFEKKTTILIGQNNSGKSNILRALAAVFNKKYDYFGQKYTYQFKKIESYFENTPIRDNNIIEDITIEENDIILSNEGISTSKKNRSLYNYASSPSFLHDFGMQNSNNEINVKNIYQRLYSEIEKSLLGTVYVPTIRFITQKGIEPQSFAALTIPGVVMSYGKIVDQLSDIDRPPTDKRETWRQQKKDLENFLTHCLEKESVTLEVPRDEKTIHVSIDGIERPIEQFGTGVEQLIIIGLASFTFPGKLVLIDEPELHFHPRAQKRMIQYLNDNVDANFVIATHSAAVLDAIDADVLQVTYDGERSNVRTITNSNLRYQAVRDLGHSPSELLQTRFAIWVEGPSDRIYIKHWIKKLEPRLTEGIDYSILFYGGKILSHHSFIDEESELVKAVSLARAFAVVMDSDRKPDKPRINATKRRVEEEIEKQGGIFWVTEGREMENYLPSDIVRQLTSNFEGASVAETKLHQVLDPNKVKKNDFARAAIAIETDVWPLDLKKRIEELIKAIEMAK